MKKYLIAFFVGSVIGGGIISSLAFLYFDKQQRSSANDTAVLDFIFDEWICTAPDDSSKLFLSQFPSRIELPSSRIGLIPDTVRSLALLVEQKYNVPKGVTIAQWILESNWGMNNLGVSNYFGHTFPAVKKYMRSPKSVKRWDRLARKWLYFASHENIAECFLIHGQYLSQSRLYRSAFVQNSPEMFVREIGKHYAEDGKYAVKIISIMRRYRLND